MSPIFSLDFTIGVINYMMAKHSLLNWRKILPKYGGLIVKNATCLRELIERNHDLIDWIEPEAGMVAFPFFKTLNSQDFVCRLVQETGVLVLPGESFDCPGHFRITLGVEPERFQKAINKLDMLPNIQYYGKGLLFSQSSTIAKKIEG
ncbi:MAG TPA: hypothetical protein DDW76_32425 [Cyanobacteria bacterium UBA11369]|nr:hypothetical protein [Cyanobacteria bacterium UBA11371]HBE21372.1 hypothetical protein [Cyanobacteria bacterium UBA11367]HBE35385.1 hypothetical protein [Cyanobacteria bacterium UBA11368]HBE53338.1 hypothetical protein [Cyanobacteria bacterium UBA11369]